MDNDEFMDLLDSLTRTLGKATNSESSQTDMQVAIQKSLDLIGEAYDDIDAELAAADDEDGEEDGEVEEEDEDDDEDEDEDDEEEDAEADDEDKDKVPQQDSWMGGRHGV